MKILYNSIYNEEKRLTLLLKEIEKFKKTTFIKLFLLINNGSSDNSEEIIRSFNLKTIKLKK